MSKKTNPKYPIYVISKGRWDYPYTARALERLRVPFNFVIEPQEYDKYATVIDTKKILCLPFSNLGLGSIPARNWVWNRAAKTGAKRHWILDDNISGFFRSNKNRKVPIVDGTVFRCAEDFTDRYVNVAMSGFQYDFFSPNRNKQPPFYLNTRVYSCILLQNDIPFRWRGRYNEDTDLSLRILKTGYCTVLFNAFLAKKCATMSLPGGNTDELYKGDGRLKMALALTKQHPDVVRIYKRWGRWQHLVDYRPFRKNKLIPRKDVKIPKTVDEYGMVFQVYDEKTDKWETA